MPQNFRTRSVSLNQRLFELVQAFPHHCIHGQEDLGGQYHVVDVILGSGKEFRGLLVMRGDTLLVPEHEEGFEAEGIESIRPTLDEWPDFAITEPDTLWTPHGTIEWGNSWRLSLFGPEDEEKNWRSVSLDEAHDEALRYDDHVEVYDDKIPAGYGMREVRLTRGGIRFKHFRARDDREEIVTIRPADVNLWVDLLSMNVDIDPSFTLGEMAALLDLPLETDQEIFHRTLPFRGGSFQPLVTAMAEGDLSADPEIEFIEVASYADEHLGVYTFFRDAHGVGFPLVEDDETTGWKKGERENYSLAYSNPGPLRDTPIRYNPELIIPESDEKVMAYLRGPFREWRQGGEIGPKPEMPVVLKTRRDITLGELIGALFSEIPVSSE